VPVLPVTDFLRLWIAPDRLSHSFFIVVSPFVRSGWFWYFSGHPTSDNRYYVNSWSLIQESATVSAPDLVPQKQKNGSVPAEKDRA
jgi:hypothetical protein